jgi:hypothetical protein
MGVARQYVTPSRGANDREMEDKFSMKLLNSAIKLDSKGLKMLES